MIRWFKILYERIEIDFNEIISHFFLWRRGNITFHDKRAIFRW